MSAPKPSWWQRLWRAGPGWLLGVPLGGVLAFGIGAATVAGFNAGMHYTNSNEFCYACHIGMDTIVEEYQASSHGMNASGVVASCSDCHVPQQLLPKLWVKIKATKDIYHTIVGTYSLENFEEHRSALAMSARDALLVRNSAECKTCHSPDNWLLERQSSAAAGAHSGAFFAQSAGNCVSCHLGTAHNKPR